MNMQTWQMSVFAEEAAARHRTPIAEFDHPKGVVCPDNPFMTQKLREDRNYVPYCGPCTPMQRLRRTEYGFCCPTCDRKSNWDLTRYNGNINVVFDPELVDPVWYAEWQIKMAHPMTNKKLQEAQAEVQLKDAEERGRNWEEDRGKKNSGVKTCAGCSLSFFGNRKRKRCKKCPAPPQVSKPASAYYSYTSRKQRQQRSY